MGPIVGTPVGIVVGAIVGLHSGGGVSERSHMPSKINV